MQNSSVIVDTCDKWGPGLWQWYCETIGIEYPKVSLWPSELQWYNLSAYRLDWRDVALITFCATILTVLRYRIQNVTLAQARVQPQKLTCRGDLACCVNRPDEQI
jgi:hypothetical protein